MSESTLPADLKTDSKTYTVGWWTEEHRMSSISADKIFSLDAKTLTLLPSEIQDGVTEIWYVEKRMSPDGYEWYASFPIALTNNDEPAAVQARLRTIYPEPVGTSTDSSESVV